VKHGFVLLSPVVGQCWTGRRGASKFNNVTKESKARRLTDAEINKIFVLLEVSALSMPVIARVMKTTPTSVASINRRFAIRKYSILRGETADVSN
jgi:hypothetical protein